MALLNKADIVSGKNNIQEIEFEELGGSLKLRPLTDGEMHRVIAKLKSLSLGNVKAKPVMDKKTGDIDTAKTMNNIELEIDAETAEYNKYKATCLAISLSLTHKENSEIYTEDDFKDFPAGSVDIIAAKVFEISGVNDPDPERMKRFRRR